jgi:hypothetical protein
MNLPVLVWYRNDLRLHFQGGESTGIERLRHYIWNQDRLRLYKETRNGLLHFDDSSKLSPWLALDCLSPHWLYQQIQQYLTFAAITVISLLRLMKPSMMRRSRGQQSNQRAILAKNDESPNCLKFKGNQLQTKNRALAQPFTEKCKYFFRFFYQIVSVIR